MRRRLLAACALAVLLEPVSAGATPVQSWTCDASAAQHWTLTSSPTAGWSFLTLDDKSSRVLTVLNASGAGTLLGVAPRLGASSAAQLWALRGSALVSAAKGGPCAAAAALVPGQPLVAARCNASDPRQLWALAPGGGALSQAGAVGEQCADVGSVLTCSSPGVSGRIYCDARAAPAARAADLAARLTVWDISALLGGWYSSPGVPRLGVNAVAFAEALHGLGAAGCGHHFANASWANSGCATSFPHATLLAASFNTSLWAAVGATISVEARATHQGPLLYTPDINTSRDQRWGRAQVRSAAAHSWPVGPPSFLQTGGDSLLLPPSFLRRRSQARTLT